MTMTDGSGGGSGGGAAADGDDGPVGKSNEWLICK